MTVIRPILTFGYETQTLTLKEEQEFLVTDIKVLRKILDAVRSAEGLWKRTNKEIEDLVEQSKIIGEIKYQKLDLPPRENGRWSSSKRSILLAYQSVMCRNICAVAKLKTGGTWRRTDRIGASQHQWSRLNLGQCVICIYNNVYLQ